MNRPIPEKFRPMIEAMIAAAAGRSLDIEIVALEPDDDQSGDPMPGQLRVWSANCHCPECHTIAMNLFVGPWHESWLEGGMKFDELPPPVKARLSSENETLSLTVEDQLIAGELDSVCAACGAGAAKWHYCSGVTVFTSLEEANAKLKQIAAKTRVIDVLKQAIARQ
jgi:hypothetical protein